MKYLVAASGPRGEDPVAKRFGHADYFIFRDTEKGEEAVFTGTGHDEPHHGLEKFRGMGIQRVIVGNVGPGAFEDIQAMGWIPYRCNRMTVDEAIAAVEKQDVPALTEPSVKRSIHSGQGHHGGTGRGLHGSGHNH